MQYKLLATALLVAFATNAHADRYATSNDLKSYQLAEGRNERSDLKKQVAIAVKQKLRTIHVAVNAGSITSFDLQVAVRAADSHYGKVAVKRLSSFKLQARWTKGSETKKLIVIENGNGH